MAESTFTFRVDEKLKAEFSETARKHDRVGSQLLRDFMRRFVNQPDVGQPDGAPTYDDWFRQSVREALADPRPSIPSEVVERHFDKKRAAAQRKYGRRAR